MKTHRFSVILVIFGLLTHGSLAQIPTDGLIAHYTFQGNANDVSGNGNHGTLFGPVLSNDRFGNPDGAYTLDGIDDYIDIGNLQILRPQLPVTIAAWIRIESFDFEFGNVFSNNYTESRYTGVRMGYGSQNTRAFATSYGDGGNGTNPTNRRTKGSRSSLEEGVWYHLAAVIRGPTDMDLYLNGVDDCGSYSGSGGALAYNDNPGRIGWGPISQFKFAGDIDELAFYGRELNAVEIATVMTGTNDSDEDGVPNQMDNCIVVSNPDQLDSDSDGLGNICDADLNNDGVVNFIDISILGSAFLTDESSPNWNPDADLDGSGVVNFLDLSPMTQPFLCVPGPGS